MNIDPTQIWTVEYSSVQGCFHVDTLDKVMEVNRQLYSEGNASLTGYVVLAVCASHREANLICEQMKRDRPD